MENLTPASVPNGETEVATFGISNVTDVLAGGATSLQNAENDIAAIVLAADASAYTIMAMPSSDTTYSEDIVFWGSGIVNYSDVVQNLVAQADPGSVPRQSGAIWFVNSASAGSNVAITNQGSGASGTDGGWTRFGLQFADTPNAGNATFINEGGLVSGTEFGGTTDLFSYSTAEAATFINQPGVVDGAAAGHTLL
jgi:hypothetical protein